LVYDAGNILLGLATVMAGLNWYIYGPRTSEAMIEKAKVAKGTFLFLYPPLRCTCVLMTGFGTEVQDEKDGNNVNIESGRGTEETKTLMAKVKKTFSRNHAMSIHINLIAVIATVGYGFVLGGRLQLQ
jgi:hypothetical protein